MQGDRFVRDLNPPISKKIQKLMKNPTWQARQVALLRAELKDDTPTVGKFFENMAKIAALPFALLGAGCQFDISGLEPDCDASPCVDAARHDAGDAEVIDDGALDAATDGTTPVDGSPDADATVVVDDRPTITLPSLNTLPNNRAFVRWSQPTETEPGKTLVGYQVSWSDGGNNYSKDITFPFTAIDILSPNTMHTITVRARYNDASYGQASTQVGVIADTSVMARYTMDEGAGTMIMDDSGNGNHGTLVNFDPLTVWTQGIIGTGLLFDGVDSYVDTGDTFNFDSTDAFTIDTWVQRSSVGIASIFGKIDYASQNFRGYWFGYDGLDRLWLEVISDVTLLDQIKIGTTTQFNVPNQPQAIVVTYDGSMAASGAKLYVDSAEQTVTVFSDNLSGGTINSVASRVGATIPVGGPVQDAAYVMDGVIDDLAIYDRDLTPDEIVNNTCAREALNREENSDTTPLPIVCN